MKEKIKNFLKGLDEFYQAPYRNTLTSNYRDENDFFMLMVFAQSLGVEDFTSFYTLELYPFLLEDFHEWHQRMNLDHSLFNHMGCC